MSLHAFTWCHKVTIEWPTDEIFGIGWLRTRCHSRFCGFAVWEQGRSHVCVCHDPLLTQLVVGYFKSEVKARSFYWPLLLGYCRLLREGSGAPYSVVVFGCSKSWPKRLSKSFIPQVVEVFGAGHSNWVVAFNFSGGERLMDKSPMKIRKTYMDNIFYLWIGMTRCHFKLIKN